MFNRLANNDLRLGRAATSSFAISKLVCRIIRFFLSCSSEFRQFGRWHKVWVLDEYTWMLTLALWFKCSRKKDMISEPCLLCSMWSSSVQRFHAQAWVWHIFWEGNLYANFSVNLGACEEERICFWIKGGTVPYLWGVQFFYWNRAQPHTQEERKRKRKRKNMIIKKES